MKIDKYALIINGSKAVCIIIPNCDLFIPNNVEIKYFDTIESIKIYIETNNIDYDENLFNID